MAETGDSITPIGIALDTSGLLAGVQQSTAALLSLQSTLQTTQAGMSTLSAAMQQASQTATLLQTSNASVVTGLLTTTAATQQLTSSLQAQTTQQQQSTQATQQLTQTLTAQQQQTTQLAQGMQSLTQALRTQAQQTQQSGQGLASWTTLVRGAELALGAFGVALSVQGLVEFGKSIVETGANFERLRVAFTNLTGTQRDGAAAFALVKRQADTTGYSIDALGDGYRRLLAQSRLSVLPQEDVAKIFVQITNALKAVGATEPEVTSALRTLEQAFSRGFLTQRQLHQGLTALPGIMDLLSQALGVSREQLNRMGTDMELVSSVVLPKLGDVLEAQFKDRLPASLNTAGTALGQFKNAWKEMENSLAESGLLDTITRRLQSATNLLQQWSGTMPGQYPAIEQAQRTALVPGIAHTPEAAAVRAAQDAMDEAGRARQRKWDGSFFGLPLDASREERTFDAARARYDAAVEALNQRANTPTVTQGPWQGPPTEQQMRYDQIQKDIQGAQNAQAALNEKVAAFNALLKTARERLTLDPAAAPKIWQETLTEGEHILKSIEGVKIQAGGGAAYLTMPGATGAAAAASPYSEQVRQAAARHGVDPTLALAIMQEEGGRNVPGPMTKYGQAWGPMQVLESTARGYGVTDLKDAAQTIEAGVRYLADIVAKFPGRPDLQAAAYHAGIPAVERAGGAIPPGGSPYKSNAQYVAEVLATQQQVQAGDTGGSAGTTGDLRERLNTLEAQRRDFAAFKGDIQTLQQLEDQLVKVSTTEEDAAAASVALKDARTREREGLERAFLQNPQQARETVQASMAQQREFIGAEQARDRIVQLRQREQDQLANIAVGLEREALGLSMTKDQLLDLHLAKAQALIDDERLTKTEKEDLQERLQAIQVWREQISVMQEAHLQAELDERRGQQVTQQAQGYRGRLESLTLTPRAQLLAQMQREGIDPDSGQGRLLLSRQEDAQLAQYGRQLTDTVLNTWDHILSGSKVSLKQIAQEWTKTLLEILMDASGARQAMTKGASDLLKQGIQAVSKLLGPRTEPSTSPTGDPSTDTSLVEPHAMGGPAFADTPYLVGERGPELFVPATSGTVVPAAQTAALVQGTRQPIVVNVYAQDAGSFIRSSGQVQRALWQAQQQSLRAA